MKEIKDIKKLGFGLMRLPVLEDYSIDIEQGKIMVDKFMETGFNYFDTAFIYNGSEEACKKMLVERYNREDYFLASKNAAWYKCENREDAIKQFETSLERTGAGYFDFYLLHNLGDKRIERFEEFKMWDFVKEKKAEGKIRHYGFSFHGTPDELKQILTDHPDAEFVQLQINYYDWLSETICSKKLYDICQSFNKPVIIMEPVKGGSLASPVQEIQDMFKKYHPDLSPSAWAIRYAASLDNVITVLSGMSNVAQMEDNIKTMKDFKALNEEEKEILNKAVDIMNSADTIACTNCKYCISVCPNQIDINHYFEDYNILKIYNTVDKAKGNYKYSLEQGKNPASKCLKCYACEGACPQHLPIVSLLEEKIVKTFE